MISGADWVLACLDVGLYVEPGQRGGFGAGIFHRVFRAVDSIGRAAVAARPMSDRDLAAWGHSRWGVAEVGFEVAPLDVEGVLAAAARVVVVLGV